MVLFRDWLILALDTMNMTRLLPVDVPKLVAVKAEEWQRRVSKVMSQAKPQLDVVRELFEEGQELGYEELIQGALLLALVLPCVCSPLLLRVLVRCFFWCRGG